MPKTKTSKNNKAKQENVFSKTFRKFSSMSRPMQVLLLSLIIGIIGGGGAVYSSYASSYLNQANCNLRGRVWTGSTTGNPCSNSCQSGAGSIVNADPYNYCSGAISKISSTTCSNNNRKWASPGCARNWKVQTYKTYEWNAPQCKASGMYYLYQSSVDKCIYSSVTPKI